MKRINKPELESEGKAGYTFIGLAKSMTPNPNNRVVSTLSADEVDNDMMSVDDGKIAGLGGYDDTFIATKVSKKTILKKENIKKDKDNKLVKTYTD